MSRFVAGFALLYVSAVSGQINRGSATADKTSIAFDSINGGNFPPGAFSIGHGGQTIGADGKPGASFGTTYDKPKDENYGFGQSGSVNGQPGYTGGSATADKPSIAVGAINGGSYPAGAFSIGSGGQTIGADGKPGASYGVTYNKPKDENYGFGQSGSVNGQPGYTGGSATADRTSIALGSINGGSYPAGAFSIGFGGQTIGADGRPGANHGVSYNKPLYEDYGQGGAINGDFGHGDTGNNGYDHTGYRPANVPVQNYNNRPNGYGKYGQRYEDPPIANSAVRNRFYDSILRFILGWF